MKHVLPIALLAGVVLLGGSKKSSAKVQPKSQYDKLTPDLKKENELAIQKYIDPSRPLIKNIPLIYDTLTPALQKFVTDAEIFVMILPDKAYEIYEYGQVIIMQKYKDKKGIADNAKLVDDIAKEVLEALVSDVYWKEKIIPYSFGSPFHAVWNSTTELIKLGAKNLEEQKGK